ncbi:MAG: DUF2892 domain-containing protein [Gammaproteobacteria bacterium]|jgi:hypothetical protein|nr:DUF2892 domain-containing protein [Gammaproteobacteria bacterium]
MKQALARLAEVHNIGLIDRVARILLGATLVGGAITSILNSSVVTWQVYVALFAIYPLMTGMLGWDPVYAVGHTKTCDLSDRNRCGTFPYQIDAMLGHNPISDEGYEYDHSLTACHHEDSKQTTA